MIEPTTIPLVVLLLEANGDVDKRDSVGDLPSPGRAALESLSSEIQAAAVDEVDLLTMFYEFGDMGEAQTHGQLCARRFRLGAGEGFLATATSSEGSVAPFPNLETALMALATLLLKRPETNSPTLVLHVTGGRFRCCAEVERAAGTVKTACDFRGAPGVFYNVWLVDDGASSFPLGETVGKEANSTAKTLFRMSSPVGAWGAEILSGLGSARPAAARYFEAVSSLGASLAARFAGAFVAHGVKQAVVGKSSGLNTCAFLMPKEGDTLDKCEDVVSIHGTQRRIAISDGATTASYSAEWARALCRHAVESPPPVFPDKEVPPPEDEQWEDAEQLKGWLEPVLEYWKPEVPWERLIRPSMFNKAKEGAGATLAGIEVLGDVGEAGVRFRAWALGDSCVIQLRGNRVLSARPVTCSAKFSHVPTLLMTQQGYQEKYVRFWQSWEATLAPGDTILLGTDALCEYVLKSFEGGGEAELLGWLDSLSFGSGPETWRSFEEFIQVKRKQGEIKNDDVGLVLIRLRTNDG
jgi:hypothetical protein